MASIASLVGVPERFAYSMTKGAVHHDDDVDRGRLREAEHPLQLHLPGARSTRRSSTVRRAATIAGREAGDAAARCRPISRSAAWARRRKWRTWRCISVPTKRRSSPARRIRSTAECSSHEAHSLRRPGQRAARACSSTTARASTRRRSATTTTSAFFGGDGLDRAARVGGARDAARAARCRRTRASARRSRRPSKIVCIGLNFRDHAAESGMDLPSEPVIFFKATTSLVGPNDAVDHPARRHERSTGRSSSRS